MDKVRILYFLEDLAQEGFITALIRRVAQEESIAADTLVHDIRSSRGGSRVIPEFKKFIRDTRRVGQADVDFLVVAIDGNCKGYNQSVKELDGYIESDHPLKGRVLYAVPDPHIERWYLMDQRALKAGIGLTIAPNLPRYKCKREHYKQVINQALKESNVNSLLGGAEYAERIVDNIENLESLGRQNAGFQSFLENLRRMLRSQTE